MPQINLSDEAYAKIMKLSQLRKDKAEQDKAVNETVKQMADALDVLRSFASNAAKISQQFEAAKLEAADAVAADVMQSIEV